MQETTENKKVPFLRSIRGRISILLVTCIVTVVVVMLLLILPNVKKSMSEMTKNYLYDITISAGERIELAISDSKVQEILDASALERLVGDIGLEGVESSYAYVVNSDGTMLYHPTASKIGQPVENAVVSGIVDDLKAGNKDIEPQVVAYEFQGVTKYAAYYLNDNADFILVVSADEDEVMQPITRLMRLSIVIGIVILAFCCVVGYILAGFMVSPVIKITHVIYKFAEMDFTENDIQKQLNKRKDETGEMSRAISTLRDHLIHVVSGLKNQSDSLFKASDALSGNVSETVSTIGQVENAVTEIAEGAGIQADETQKAAENVVLIGNMVKDTSKEVEGLLANALEMQNSGNEASATLTQLEEVNRQAKTAIDTIYEQTNTTNDSAMKIREATVLITSIAEETNLLSLNASIEAARAGEQGRGFAVVASQIQKLAEQSNESAIQIKDITDSLINDSEKAVAIMGEVKEIIEKQSGHVAKTDEIFAKVKNGIDSSIDSVNLIAEKTANMDEARINVVDVVQNLSAVAQENAAGTEETSASVTEIGSIMTDISGNTGKMKNVADELDRNMRVFKL